MTITRSSAAERRRSIERRRLWLVPETSHRAGPAWRAREGAGLGGAMLVAIAALFLTALAKRPLWTDLDGRLARGELLDLSTSPSSDQIARVLGVIESPSDRSFAADRIARSLAGRRPDHVGEIAGIWVTETEIRAARGLVSYPVRLEEARRIRQVRQERSPFWTRWTRWAVEASGLSDPAELRVPLFARGQFAEVKPGLVTRRPAAFARSLALSGALMLLGFAAVHVIWSVRRFPGDEVILPSLMLLSGLALALMGSLRDPLRDVLLVANVGWGTLAGCAMLLGASLIDYERLTSRLTYLPLLTGVLISAALILFGSGPTGSDAKVNLLGLQPVEAIKVLLVLFLAGFFARRWEPLRELRESRAELGGLSRRFAIPRLDHVLPVLACVALTLLFFFLQKDLGPALVMSCVFLALYAVARRQILLVTAGLATIAAGFAAGYWLGYPATVSTRIHMWLSPWDNFARGGDQIAHSLWALSSGGTFGAGLGLGRPGYIPAGHTDLILSTAGEELGFAGLAVVGLVFALLVHRGIQIARRAPSDYGFFLALGLTALIAFQLLLITGGLLGLIPLTGMPTLLLSHGNSSRCASFAIFGALAALSATGRERSRVPATLPFRKPLAAFAGVLIAFGSIALARAAYVQVLRGDDTAAAGTLTLQADLQRRYQYNPRLLEIARGIPRGTILDRHGLPLATSDWEVLERHRADYDRLGVSIDRACRREDGRHYPFGGALFHVLGDVRTRVNWGASNTSFLERDAMATLQGYDTHPRAVEVEDPVSGRTVHTLAYDYSELVPLLRHRSQPGHEAVRRVTERPRDVQSTVDARLQTQLASILTRRLAEAGKTKGAVVVLDAATGELLASVSYPWPDLSPDGRARAGRSLEISRGTAAALGEVVKLEKGPLRNAPQDAAQDGDAYLDRARYGLYPPGSTFKLVVAMAALDAGRADARFTCGRLPGGGVGARVPRWGILRDDVKDTEPHGTIGLDEALAVSCNAYFGQLAARIGEPALYDKASAFGISVARPNTPEALARTLAPAGFGQGQVVASPLQMARVAAAVAEDGAAPQPRWIQKDPTNDRSDPPRTVVTPAAARRLGRAMRSVVTSGTGQRLLQAPVPVAGKTGTAEVAGAPSHAWFTGFAPYTDSSQGKLAFAVIVENGRYGGGIAATIAADVVAAAHDLGLDQ